MLMLFLAAKPLRKAVSNFEGGEEEGRVSLWVLHGGSLTAFTVPVKAPCSLPTNL